VPYNKTLQRIVALARHLFRNLYKSTLKPQRVAEMSDTVGPLIDAFAQCHTEFIRWIDELIQAEET